MSDESKYHNAVEQLKSVLEKVKSDQSGKKGVLEVKFILKSGDSVFNEYGSFFKKENVQKISEEKLKTKFEYFLKFHDADDLIGNHHWTNIGRNSEIFDDMVKFRNKLANLLDDSKPIEERYNEIKYDRFFNKNGISGMGKAKITPVLLVAFKDKYGVWNEVSEEALKKLKLWPNFKGVKSEGCKYKLVNDVLLRLVSEYKDSGDDMDLWVLDALLYWFVSEY